MMWPQWKTILWFLKKLNRVTIWSRNSTTKYIPNRTEDIHLYPHKNCYWKIYVLGSTNSVRTLNNFIFLHIWMHCFCFIYSVPKSWTPNILMTNYHFLFAIWILFFCILKYSHFRPFLNISNAIFRYVSSIEIT